MSLDVSDVCVCVFFLGNQASMARKEKRKNDEARQKAAEVSDARCILNRA